MPGRAAVRQTHHMATATNTLHWVERRRRGPQGRRRAVREQRLRHPLPADGRGRAHRRRQRARAAARAVPGARRAAGARDARPLGPHPGRAGDPRGRLRGRRHRARRAEAEGRRLRRVPRRRRGDRGRAAAPGRHPQPRPHAGLDLVRTSAARRCCSPATRCSPAVPATRSSRTATSRRSSARSRPACSRSRTTRSSSPATASTPRSAPSARTSTSGSTAAGERRRGAVARRAPLRPAADRRHAGPHADLPPTPIRDRNIPATAWVEAPADLLALGADLPGTPVAEYKRRIGPWLLWRAGPASGGDARYWAGLAVRHRPRLHAAPASPTAGPTAPAPAARSTTASAPGRKTSATTRSDGTPRQLALRR